MSGKKGSKLMNKKDWDVIKVLTSTDLSDTMVASIVNRGATTAARVRVSTSFDDYVATMREYQQRYKESEAQKSIDTTELEVSDHVRAEAVETESIANKLDTIIALLQNIESLNKNIVANQFATKSSKWYSAS